jgi:hypothetical protein
MDVGLFCTRLRRTLAHFVGGRLFVQHARRHLRVRHAAPRRGLFGGCGLEGHDRWLHVSTTVPQNGRPRSGGARRTHCCPMRYCTLTPPLSSFRPWLPDRYCLTVAARDEAALKVYLHSAECVWPSEMRPILSWETRPLRMSGGTHFRLGPPSVVSRAKRPPRRHASWVPVVRPHFDASLGPPTVVFDVPLQLTVAM